MTGMKQLDMVSKWIVVIGCINWGLVGVGSFAKADLNVVGLILGGIAGGVLANLVYVLVGLSALYMLWGMFKK